MALLSNIISLFSNAVPDAEQHSSQDSTHRADTIQEVAPRKPPIFCSDRIFYQSGFRNQDPGWYFNARGGSIEGPFLSRSLAIVHLNAFIANCQQQQDTGGRALHHQGN
jgi:hypothetical protein